MAVSFVNTQQPRIDAWIQPGCRADIAVVSTESWPVDTVVTIGVADAAGVIAVPLLTITPDLATLTATVALTGVQVAALAVACPPPYGVIDWQWRTGAGSPLGVGSLHWDLTGARTTQTVTVMMGPAGPGATPVQQVALTGDLAYTLPAGAPTDQVVGVVFTQDGTGGHTVTYGGSPVTVDTAAGASTLVEVWPGGVVRYPPPDLAPVAVTGSYGDLIDKPPLGDLVRRDKLALGWALDATETPDAAVVVIGSVDGVPYGRHSTTGGLWTTADEGSTWTQIAGAPYAQSIHATGDNEVIVNTGATLVKSTGWEANPVTATWAVVSTANAASFYFPCDVDAYANLVICGEYAGNKADARYVKVSTDYGATFTPVLDLNVLHPSNLADTHWHAVCIDPWHTGPNPRLWASHGDGPRGIYYSDDLGATWTLYDATWQPMPIAATPSGIVTSTDQNNPDGVWIIPRDLSARRQLLRIDSPFWADSLLGFGQAWTRDTPTGDVIMMFRGDQQTFFNAGNPGRIFVTDGVRASEIWATQTAAPVGVLGNTNWDGACAVTTSGRLLATYVASGSARRMVAGTIRLASVVPDPGNALTGSSANRYAISIGPGASARMNNVFIGAEAGRTMVGTDEDAVLVGTSAVGAHKATAVGAVAQAAVSAVAVGADARAGTQSTAMGAASRATSTSATAIGQNASAASNGTSVGRSSNASGSDGTAVGGSAVSSGAQSTGVGAFSSATGLNAVAVGANATASHVGSVALGQGVTTSGDQQVRVGPRHLEFSLLSADPPAPTAGRARIYVRETGTGTGKYQLVVRFATGPVQVIATEP